MNRSTPPLSPAMSCCCCWLGVGGYHSIKRTAGFLVGLLRLDLDYGVHCTCRLAHVRTCMPKKEQNKDQNAIQPPSQCVQEERRTQRKKIIVHVQPPSQCVRARRTKNPAEKYYSARTPQSFPSRNSSTTILLLVVRDFFSLRMGVNDAAKTLHTVTELSQKDVVDIS